MPGFSIVGPPDKAVSEARDRVRVPARVHRAAIRKNYDKPVASGFAERGFHSILPIALSALLAARTPLSKFQKPWFGNCP
jgi:predicted ATPase with chaperone activity